MGTTSNTGHGPGSAEPPLSQFNNLGWFRKVTNIDASQISGGIVNNETFEYLANVRADIQMQIDAIGGVQAVPNVVQVSSISPFQSIAAAADSITDSSEDNRYIIRVAPGIYTEPQINLPPFVYVLGEQIDSVVVQPSGDHHIFNLATRSAVVNLTISGAHSGFAGMYTRNVGNFVTVHKVTVENCSIGCWNEANDDFESFFYLEYVDFENCDLAVFNRSISAGVAFLQAQNLWIENDDANPADALICDGVNAEVDIQAVQFLGCDNTGNAIRVTNGGHFYMTASRIYRFGRGLYADTNGMNPKIDVTGTLFDEVSVNLDIANTTATGTFTGYSEHSKTIINNSSEFFITNKDARTITVSKKGGDYSSVKDAVDSITDNDYDNRYNIIVGPGVYLEDTITMKDYVSVSGDETRSTVIELKSSPTTNDLVVFPNNVNTTLRKVLLRNDTSGNAVRYHGGVSHLEQVRFGTNATSTSGVAINATGVDGEHNSLMLTNCTTARVAGFAKLMKFSTNGGAEEELPVMISGFSTLDTEGGFRQIAEIGVEPATRGVGAEVQFIPYAA